MRNTFKGLCICAVLASAMAVQAADLDQTTYLKFDAGLSIVNDIDVTRVGPFGDLNAEIEVDPGLRLDVAGGYNFSEAWAVEIEAGFIWNSVKDTDWDLYQVPILANVIYTIPLKSALRPYIGGGAGGLFGVVSGDDDDESDFTFAFQGLAGVNYGISENTEIGIGYKFLGALEPEFGDIELDNIYTHSILAVLKWSF